MQKTTFALFFGNRGFFPGELVAGAREALVAACEKNGYGYIMMDELGIFEKDASAFRQAVVDCLNSDCHVLGVLQKADDPYLDAILNRSDVLVFTVTKENRDALVQPLLEALLQLK